MICTKLSVRRQSIEGIFFNAKTVEHFVLLLAILGNTYDIFLFPKRVAMNKQQWSDWWFLSDKSGLYK